MFANVNVEEFQECSCGLKDGQACLRVTMSIRAITEAETENQGLANRMSGTLIRFNSMDSCVALLHFGAF